ncbi:MAG: flagellar basal body rod protein FlgB [Desulfobacterales bacterium]
MTDSLSYGNTLRVLKDAIRVTQKRNTLISMNISNLETPNYRGKDIDFKTAMDRAMTPGQNVRLAKTDPRHIDIASDTGIDVEPDEEEGEWNGTNWVNVDHAMMKLTENSLLYRTATDLLLKKIALMKEVIREGGR